VSIISVSTDIQYLKVFKVYYLTTKRQTLIAGMSEGFVITDGNMACPFSNHLPFIVCIGQLGITWLEKWSKNRVRAAIRFLYAEMCWWQKFIASV
jgi:hypothetical protein